MKVIKLEYHFAIPNELNGSLQWALTAASITKYSCLETPMGGGAWLVGCSPLGLLRVGHD